MAFLRERGPKARYVTSVCTGALVLGAAGLLDGCRATTHWTAIDLLPLVGATPVRERVVIDRDRITGAGVTAGIDFGLVVIDRLWGRALAESLQLVSEYEPAPPFHAGSPLTADARTVAAVQSVMHGGVVRMAAAAADARRGLA